MSEEQNTTLESRGETLKNMQKILSNDGWRKVSVGQSQTIDYDYRFDLYIRIRNLSEIYEKRQKNYDVFLKNTSNNVNEVNSANTHKLRSSNDVFCLVSNSTMGIPIVVNDTKTKSVEHPLNNVLIPSEKLPILSSIGNYVSIQSARSNEDALVIAYDSEWYYEETSVDIEEMVEGSKRQLLSWQFACICKEELHEFVFIRKQEKYMLSLELALGRILDSLKLPNVDIRSIRRYSSLTAKDSVTGKYRETVFHTTKEALQNSITSFSDGKKVHSRLNWCEVSSIPIILLCHVGKVDVSAFHQQGVYHRDVLKYCAEVQGGLVSLKPIYIQPDSVNPVYAKNRTIVKYPVRLQIADTMCHAPSDKKKLEDLGKVIGWEKVELAEDVKNHMDRLLQRDPCKYFEYASNDSIVTLFYCASLYGYNKKIPVTLTSASANVIRSMMMKYLNCTTTEEFDHKYRGLQKVKHANIVHPNKAQFVENSSLEPISDKARIIQIAASLAFRGGYNSSSEIGYFPVVTVDYDLKNAYPTAMCLISDVNWENPIQRVISERYMSLDDFAVPMVGGYAPLSLMVGYIRFRFPEKVRYPCIPVDVDGIPIYPRTSDGVDGVYACGPEIYLALRLGAEIYCERGYFLNSIKNVDTGYYSFSLCFAVKQLVYDREQAKRECGKGSLEEEALKMMVNAGYGKNAQNVIQKQTWSAYKDCMEDIGCSAITNPVSACMITSIVRAELLAAQNQCHELGYVTYSVTTDGFISNIPEEELKSLDLYGIRRFMEESRLFLTDGESSELWEVKHAQDDLLNFTTRGNISLYWKASKEQLELGITEDNPFILNGIKYNGVCAHNGAKSGYVPDSYEDRLWLRKSVASRIGRIQYTKKEWTGFKDLVKGEEFKVHISRPRLSMDYDMKRKPVKNSFEAKKLIIDGESYEIATFTTVPFENVEEFRKYRQVKENTKCLRTMDDWEMFWFKLEVKDSGSTVKVRDKDWSILFSCVIGHRAGLWTIPMLDALKGESRWAWLNSHNTSSKKFTSTDWKNAGRSSRQSNMLQREMLVEKLDELRKESNTQLIGKPKSDGMVGE